MVVKGGGREIFVRLHFRTITIAYLRSASIFLHYGKKVQALAFKVL